MAIRAMRICCGGWGWGSEREDEAQAQPVKLTVGTTGNHGTLRVDLLPWRNLT
jgi:hypothetical protein